MTEQSSSISKGPILGQAETFNEAVTQFKTRLFKYNLNKSPRLCAELKVDGYQSTSGEGTNSHFAYVALISDARAKGLIKVDPNLAPRRNRFPLQYTSHAQLDALVITDFHFLANQKSIRFSHRWQFEPSGISPIKTFGPAIKTALIFRDLVRKCCLAGLLDVKDRESLKFEQGSRTSRTLPPPSNSKTPSSSPECASDSPPSPSPPTSPSGTSSSALPPEASLSPAENAPPSPTPVEPEPDQVDLEEETASTSSRTSQATLDDRSTTSSAPSSASEKIENRSSLEDWELVKARTQGWLFKSHHQALSRFTRSNLESAVSPPARFRYFIRSRIEANFFYSEGDSLDAIRDRIFAEAVERKLLEATAEGRKKFKKQVSRHPSEIGCVFRFDDENDVVRVTAPPHTKARKLWHHFFKECAARGIIRYPGSSQVKPSPIASSEVELVADITLTEPILSRPADSQLGSIVSTDSSEAASSMPSVSLSPLPSTDNKPETPLEDLACPKTPLDSAKKEEEDPTVEVISSNDTRLNPPSDPSFLDGFFPHDELPLDEANAEVGIQQSTESEVEEPSPNGSLNLNAESATRGLKEPSSRPPPLKIRLDAHALNQIEAQGGKFSCKIEVVLPGFETVSASTPRRKTTFEQIRDELIERGALTQDSSQPEQVQTLPFNTSMDGSGLFRTLRKYCQSNGGGKIKMHWTLEAPGHPRVSIGTGTTKGFKKSPSRLVRLAIEQGVIEYEGPAEQDIKKVEASASPSSRADPIQPDISPNSSNETLTGSSSDDTPSASSDSPISDSRNPSPSSDATSSNEPTAPSFPLSEKSQI
ncbi:uncharacterized protein JCM6883_006525 [Sporobolomyces salmoneus]|uniref:uncharacterized protein n=1 Tax=Sporobolomyces salmoneus TaxID=183962 RepID=UPI0031817FF1